MMAQQVGVAVAAVADTELVRIKYVGQMQGTWGVNGKASGIHYDVNYAQELRMPDGRLGVDPRDAAQILVLDRGLSFQRVRG
jgi:hypothetical protein